MFFLYVLILACLSRSLVDGIPQPSVSILVDTEDTTTLYAPGKGAWSLKSNLPGMHRSNFRRYDAIALTANITLPFTVTQSGIYI